MNKKYLTRAASALAAALISATFATAQTQVAPDSSASTSQAAKPSPYQGVSTPPPDDTITTSEEPPAQPKPVVAPLPPGVVTTSPAPPAADPDAGLVVTTPVADDASDDDYDTPELKTRSAEATDTADADSDDDIVTYAPGPANALPTGTAFSVHILQDVDAAQTAPGTPFRALLIKDLLYKGRIVVPVGSELHGRIIYTSYGRRIGGRSVVHLRADEFVLPDGTRYSLHAEVIDTQASDTKVIGEGNIASKDHPKVLLAEVAVASGGGALAGARFGPAGVAVGSAVGAGIMGTHWLMATHAVDVPAHSTIIFSLTSPMFLTPAR